MNVEQLPAVKVNAPEYFARADFMLWLHTHRESVATWHQGWEANENSDVFITYDHGDGSEFSDKDFPEDIRDELCAIMEGLAIGYGVIWLTNLEE